jgi:hypothetical protein
VDYDQVASKERLSGRAYFNPGITGGLGITSMPWLDMGNIQMMSLGYGIKRKEHYKARRGVLIADRFDAYSSVPQWTITGDEFTTATLFLVFLGTVAANFTQTAATNQSVPFNVHIGGVLDIGKVACYNASVSGGGVGSPVSGVDYVFDGGPGKLYVPLTSGFTENTAATLTVSWPTVLYNRILPPMSNLNRTGMMQIIEEDDSQPVAPAVLAAPKTVHDFAVSLSMDTGGDSRVDAFKEYKMIATITDPTTWSIKKRNQ